MDTKKQAPGESQSNKSSENCDVNQNRDNDDLLPTPMRNARIGYVDEVNGAGAEEITRFVPTRYELTAIASNWMHVQLDEQYFYFRYQQAGSDSSRRIAFAGRRIERLADVLGRQAVTDLWDQVCKDFPKDQGIDPKEWNVFVKGTSKQMEALQLKIESETKDFWNQIKQAEQQIHASLAHDAETERKMIEFLHHYRAGRSIADILSEKHLVEDLFQILSGAEQVKG